MSEVPMFPSIPDAGRGEVDKDDVMHGWRRPPSANTFHCYDRRRRSLCELWQLAGLPDPGVPNGTAGAVYAVCDDCTKKAPAPCPRVALEPEPKVDAPAG